MERTTLQKTGIDDLQGFRWTEYFPYNNSHLMKLDYSVRDLTEEEKALISPSIRAFQIGEGSEGTHLRRVVKRFAQQSGYPEYIEIMDWFIKEENRHSQTLKKFMELYGIAAVSKLWLDNTFRFLRKMLYLECEVVVLVTAEIIALSYYAALSNATGSKLLKTICAQMLHDELRHVVLQSDTLHRISKNRSESRNRLVRTLRRRVMGITAFVVWHKYKELFLRGGYPYQTFKEHCFAYLTESIRIERTGNLG